MVPAIAGHDTVVLMHNDAVVQGLSEAPFMQDVASWAVLTDRDGSWQCKLRQQREVTPGARAPRPAENMRTLRQPDPREPIR